MLGRVISKRPGSLWGTTFHGEQLRQEGAEQDLRQGQETLSLGPPGELLPCLVGCLPVIANYSVEPLVKSDHYHSA